MQEREENETPHTESGENGPEEKWPFCVNKLKKQKQKKSINAPRWSVHRGSAYYIIHTNLL